VGPQELAPAELGANAGRRHAGSPQELGDRRSRDAHADSGEFTDDPMIAPTRVLTREPQHQLPDLLGDPGSTRSSSSRIRPPSPHKLAMPPRRVSGWTKNDRLVRPSSWPAAARKTRSRSSSRGRATCRRSTASSWRSTTISSSLNSRERKRSAATANERRNSRYSNDTTKKQPPSTRIQGARLYGRNSAPRRFEPPDGFTYPTPAESRSQRRLCTGRGMVPRSSATRQRPLLHEIQFSPHSCGASAFALIAPAVEANARDELLSSRTKQSPRICGVEGDGAHRNS
jgi:hypothetical protein